MARDLSVIHIPAAFPNLAKKRGFSPTSGLDSFSFYCLFNFPNLNLVKLKFKLPNELNFLIGLKRK
jgi:hypothetical protein